jgi:hypothetical protein
LSERSVRKARGAAGACDIDRNPKPNIEHAITHMMRNFMPINKQGQIVETGLDARGAERGPTMRNVLMLSTSLAVIALVVVYAAFVAD